MYEDLNNASEEALALALEKTNVVVQNAEMASGGDLDDEFDEPYDFLALKLKVLILSAMGEYDKVMEPYAS